MSSLDLPSDGTDPWGDQVRAAFNTLNTDKLEAASLSDSAARAVLDPLYAPKSAVTGYDVILLAGQSNMSGRGTGATSATDPTNSMIFQLKGKTPNKGTIIAAAEPLDMVDTPTGIGPGFQFARWYLAAGLNRGRKILLVPAAQGGTPLTRIATPTWKPSSADLYTNAIAQANTAIAAEAGSKIVAVLWLQGETDGDLNATGTAYQTEFDALVAGFRAGITGATDVPFIVGQMVPEFLSTGTRTQINAVHGGAQGRLAKVAFVPGPAASNLGDNNHYNLAGQRAMGRDMFTAYVRTFTGLPAAFSYVPTGDPALGTTLPAERAYSLRKVVSAYAGSAVRVRRSSDNTESDIGFTTGALDTTALLAFAGAGSAFVTTWYDQSGNARHITQATTGAQPTIVATGSLITSGGKPCVQFDGSDDHLFATNPSLYLAGAASVAVVLSATAAAASRWWTESIAATNTAQYGMLEPDAAPSINRPFPVVTGMGTLSPQPTLAFFDGTTRQGVSVDTGTTFSQWVDGTADGMQSAAYTRLVATMDRFTLGGVLRAGSLAPLPMKLSEAVFFKLAIDSTARTAATTNQKTFYSIA